MIIIKNDVYIYCESGKCIWCGSLESGIDNYFIEFFD